MDTTKLIKKSKALLDEYSKKVSDAEDRFQRAFDHANETERAMQDALAAEDELLYYSAKTEHDKALAAVEVAKVRLARAKVPTAEEVTAAKKLNGEIEAAIIALDTEKRADLKERLEKMKQEAMETQRVINELEKCIQDQYFTFINLKPKSPYNECPGLGLHRSLWHLQKSLINPVYLMSDKM